MNQNSILVVMSRSDGRKRRPLIPLPILIRTAARRRSRGRRRSTEPKSGPRILILALTPIRELFAVRVALARLLAAEPAITVPEEGGALADLEREAAGLLGASARRPALLLSRSVEPVSAYFV